MIANSIDDAWRQAVRRNGAGAVAGVNARFFDVLHHAAHQRARPRTALLDLLGTACFVRFKVSDDVDINFNGIGQEAINQDWGICQVAHVDGSGHVAA